MPRGKKKCKSCSTLIYAFSKQCTSCGFVYGAKSSGRPMNTKASDGYAVGTSGGRPSSTKVSDGYAVGTSGGRPSGTSAFDGYAVGTNGGRPSGTKVSDGYAVGTSGGRPSGTKASDGCSVGRSGGRGKLNKIVFDESIELPTEWDLSEETLNLHEDLLSECRETKKGHHC